MSVLEQLIECVKLYKILYDLSDSEYKNTRKKDKVWEDIGKELGLAGEDVKKKWKNLRDSYAKHLRSEKTHTGQEAKKVCRYKTWPWAQQMSYFKPFLQLAPTQSNVSDMCIESQISTNKTLDETGPLDNTDYCEQTEEVHYEPENCRATCENTHRKTKRDQHVGSQSSSVSQMLNYLQNHPRNTPLDEIELLFMSYAKAIKKFSTRRQTIVKFKIAQIMMEEELAQQSEDSFGSSGSASNPVTGKQPTS